MMRWVRRRAERDLNDEIASHFRMAIAERVARGESPADAEAAVRREFGNELLVREVTRSMWRGAGIERVLQEFRIAFRTLWRTPRFTFAALTCIAVGVGVTTTIFSALNGILLRPLPYPNANSLISLRAQSLDGRASDAPITPAELKAWSSARTVTRASAWLVDHADFTGPEDAPERVVSAQISPHLFELLGVAPLIGRGVDEQDATMGAQPVVVLSYELWRRRFGEDRSVVGRTIELYRRQWLVVGVMPEGFSFPDRTMAWVPSVFPPNLPDNILFYSGVLARLAPGVTLEQARSEFGVINRQLVERDYKNWRFSVVSLHEDLLGSLRKPILLFQGAALLVLLIACANVAALLLARGSARQRELAVRAAIGAGRRRLVSHVLIECITLGLMGSALGVAVALAGVRLIALSFPDGVPSYVDLGIQLPVLGFTLVIALLCAIGFGIVPALRAGRTRSNDALHTATRVTSTRSRRQGRNLLITAEIALTVILVAFAAVLVQSEVLLRRSLGFRPDGLLTVRVPLPTQVERYRGDAAQRAFFTELQNRLKALPGVESVSASLLQAPLDGDTPGFWNLIIDGVPSGSKPDERTRAAVFSISPGYLATLGIPLVHGRALTSADTATAERAILVNEMFVRRYLPAGDAIGHRVGWDVNDGKPRPLRIVGVIADYRQQRPPGEVLPTVYTNNDFAFPWQTFMLRTRLSDPATLAPAIRAIVRELDPTLVTYGLQTQERLVRRSFWRERLQGRVVGIFALLALLLAVFGMYGVLSYAVAQRTSELGVRVALGASPSQLLLLTLGQAARAGLAGVTIGVAFAVAATRLLSGLLYGVSATDPRSLALSALLLLGVAILAGVLPARRAAKLDPATAIRLS